MNFGIIAAGEGSRLAQEGVVLPKPLVSVGGKPMIGRLVDIFLSMGADKVCIIVNESMYEVQGFVEYLVDENHGRVEMVVKSTPSSMHSFHELAKLLKGHGRFIVTTVDTIFRPEDFRRYVDAFASAPDTVDGMMALTSFVDDEKPLYVDVDAGMNIRAFRDAPTPEGCCSSASESVDLTEYVSGGIYGLDDRAIRVLDECIEAGVQRMRNYQRALVAAGLHLKGFDMGQILDMDHAADIAKAEAFLR